MNSFAIRVSLFWGLALGASISLAQSGGSVSADLLKRYRVTEEAASVVEFTQIVDFCQIVAEDRSRSEVDRNYASQLLAWAANRRGELRSDEAGDLVNADQTAEAAKLDKLSTADFRLALKYDPTKWKAKHNLAIALAMNKDIPASIQTFTEVIAQNPKYTNALFNRGELFFQTQQYTKAVGDYTAAIAIDPQDPLLYSSRGHARFLLGDVDSALADYQKASELAPSSADLATDWADACQSLYHWKDAAEAYRRALKIDAAFPRALQNAAWMMATCPEAFYRDPKTALVAAQRAISSSKETPRSLDTLAAAQAATGDFAKAQLTARRAISLADADEQADIRSHLDLYAKNRAYLQAAALPVAGASPAAGQKSAGTQSANSLPNADRGNANSLAPGNTNATSGTTAAKTSRSSAAVGTGTVGAR